MWFIISELRCSLYKKWCRKFIQAGLWDLKEIEMPYSMIFYKNCSFFCIYQKKILPLHAEACRTKK